MSVAVPRTVKAIDTTGLLRLDDEARAHRFNRHHGPGWLAEHAATGATHYLYPVLVHVAPHRPESSPHLRCMLLLRLRNGQEIFSLLDVRPQSFERLPETLDAATKAAITRRLNGGGLKTQAAFRPGEPG